jgi:hypothetical protein
VLARRAVAQLLTQTPIERVFGEVRHIFAPIPVGTTPMLPSAEVAPRRLVQRHEPGLIVFGESAAEIGLAVAVDEAEELIESLGEPLPVEEESAEVGLIEDATEPESDSVQDAETAEDETPDEESGTSA